jgi:outer membrane receptor protein involved in Fe transport
MRTALFRAFIATGTLVAVFAASERDASAQAASTVGSVRGQIKDKATGEAAVGATIVATSPALQGEQVVLADESGLYFLTSLPPGSYTLTVYYNDGTFTRGNVTVAVGKEAVVNISVDSAASTGKPKGETIEIQGSAPVIDQGSTKTGVSITADFTNNVPVGRTFGQVLSSASGSQNDFYGTSLSGATSVENTYVVEGINTTDTGTGRLSSNLPNEFVQETEIITGGYNAEYGRATGGVVNVVTKQGSNQFHGSVFAYYKPGQLSADAKIVEKEGGAIAYAANLDYSYDVGAEIGGPIIKDKLWFHVGFNPQRTRNINTRTVQSQFDRNMDGIADFNPNTGITLHEPVSTLDVPDAASTYYFTGKINGEINQNNQFQLSVFGNPRTGNRTVNTADVFVYAPDDFLINRSDGAYDVAAKYTSKFNNGQTQVDALAGFHRGYSTLTAPNATTSEAFVYYNYTRSLFDFADIEGADRIARCNDNDPNDPYPMIQNCPVSLYAEQGLGGLEERTNDRLSAILSATQRVKAFGYHVLKAGIDIERSTYNSKIDITGGATYRRNCNLDPATGAPMDNCDDMSGLPATWRVFRYAHIVRNLTPAEIADPDSVTLQPGEQIVNCAGGTAICGPDPGRGADTHNRSIGAYLQDSWQLRPNLTLNAGVRFEQQTLFNSSQMVGRTLPTGEVVPDTAFTLNNWAPRLGAIYDPTSEGKSKLFVHWGRFYENIPGDINVRSFGGEIDDIHNLNTQRLQPGDAGFDPNCFVNHMPGVNPASMLAQCNDAGTSALLGGGGALFVAPNMKGQYTQELVVGAEYELLPDMKVALTYTHRAIPIVIEDVSADGANNYLIANPGENYDKEVADLLARAARAEMDAMAAEQAGDEVTALIKQNLADSLTSSASNLNFVKKFDKPSRTYNAVTLRVEQRPSRHSLLVGSYTYSQTKGNYPGLFSTETNQLDPNITSLYDLPDLMANRYGPMGLDRPHNIKLDGFYQIDLKETGLVTLGGSVRAQSGLAHNALAAHPVYGDGESYLLPRGSIDRSPVTSNVDLHVSYGRRLDKNMVLEAFVRGFNVFDQQEELNVDENYTLDNALPIVGGDEEDLKHAKSLPDGVTMANQTLLKNKNFNHTNLLTVPRSFQFGVRLTF